MKSMYATNTTLLSVQVESAIPGAAKKASILGSHDKGTQLGHSPSQHSAAEFQARDRRLESKQLVAITFLGLRSGTIMNDQM